MSKKTSARRKAARKQARRQAKQKAARARAFMNARQQRAMLKRQADYRREQNASAEAAGTQYLAWVKANKPYGVKDNSEAFFGFIAGWTLRAHFRPVKAKPK